MFCCLRLFKIEIDRTQKPWNIVIIITEFIVYFSGFKATFTVIYSLTGLGPLNAS